MFSDIQKRYKWYVALRIVIVLSILIPGILTLIRGTEFNLLPLILIMVMTLIMSALFMVILKRHRESQLHYYIQLIFDNLLIFAIIYYTGGNDSIFSILYYVNITTAAFFLLVKGSFIISGLAAAGYAFLMLGEYFGIFISPYEISYGVDMPLESVIMRVYINALSFFLISAVSGFLSERIQSGREEFQRYRIRLKDIINNLQSAIIVTNRNLKITDFNMKCRELFPEIMNDMPVSEIDPELFSDIRGNTYTQFSRDGKHYDLRIESMKYKEFQNNYIITIYDITQMKLIEQKLIDRERLSAIGELAASIAHEIRNPLSSIKGSVQIIQDELDDSVSSHPMFNIVLEEIERLNKMIVGFLDYSKEYQPDIKIVNLYRLVDSIVKLMNKDNTIRIDNISGDITIFADEDKMKQVFINLLKNSLKATENVPDPAISISYSRDEGMDHIYIRDNGKGISKSIYEKLFVPFNNEDYRGTGLGLAIVYKIIVDEHQGEISVNSEPGNTCFDISLRREE